MALGPLTLTAAEADDGFRPCSTAKTDWLEAPPPGGPQLLERAAGGILKNTVENGQHGVDLLTEKKFWNFTVRYEYMTPDGSNSGFYLRGR